MTQMANTLRIHLQYKCEMHLQSYELTLHCGLMKVEEEVAHPVCKYFALQQNWLYQIWDVFPLSRDLNICAMGRSFTMNVTLKATHLFQHRVSWK